MGIIFPIRLQQAVLCLTLLLGGFSGSLDLAKAQSQSPQTSAPHAFLIDADTKSVLFEKDADALVIPASTAKIMTAEIVFHELREGRLKLDTQFTVSENAWRFGGAPSRGSSMFAIVNRPIPLEDLIRGLVIVSANDAAITLAEGIAGSEGAFATLMNKRARELGLKQSVFSNSWGRGDPEQKVTAREMVELAAHVIQTYPDYYKYFGERDFTWNKIKQPNRNPLLLMDFGADGLKTGNIDASGYGIVGSATQNGQRLILALYGAKSSKERGEEARKLFQWGFRSFDSKEIFKDGEVIGSAKIFGGASSSVELVANASVRILIPHNSAEKYSGKIVYTGPLMAPIEQGTRVADLKIYRGTSEVLNVPLQTAEAVAVGSLPRRALDGGFEAVIALFRKYFTKP